MFYFLMFTFVLITGTCFQNQFFIKILISSIIIPMLLHFFCEGKLAKKIFYYIMSVNCQLVVEIVGLSILTFIFKVDFTKLSHINSILLVLIPSSFFICYLHIMMGKILKRELVKIQWKYILGLTILTMTQSFLALVQSYYYTIGIPPYIFLPLFICIILTYFSVKYISSYIYTDYKYKENTLYFIKLYDQQLKDYLKLKDSEEEIQYLRHEIMNQLLTYNKK